MDSSNFGQAFEPGEQLLSHLLALAPTGAMALLSLVVGVVCSLILQRVICWLVRTTGLEAIAERAGVAKFLYAFGIKHGLSFALGRIAFFSGLLITLAVVAEIVGLPGVADGVGAIVEFIPDLVAAGALTVFGLIAADFLSRLVERIVENRRDLLAPEFASAIVYYGVLAVILTTAAQHLGLQTDLVNLLLAITLASILLATGLAFALGSRLLIQEVLSRHYVQRMFPLGDRLRFGEIEGVVQRYYATCLSLKTRTGETVIPYRLLLEQAVHVERVQGME